MHITTFRANSLKVCKDNRSKNILMEEASGIKKKKVG